MALPEYGFHADAPWTTWGTGFTRVNNAQFTVADGDFAQHAFAEGRVLRYYDTALDAWAFGQVILATPAAGTLTVDLRGAPFTATVTNVAWSWQSGGRLVTREYLIPGRWADAANAALLLTDILLKNERWPFHAAAIIGYDVDVIAEDTGANQPHVNVTVDGAPICTANANAGVEVDQATTVATGVDIDTAAYMIPYGGLLEITTDAAGSNNDSSDLKIVVLGVVEE